MKMTFKANEDNVRILGRTKFVDNIRYINYSCSGIEFEFIGKSVSVVLCTDKSKWEEIFKAYAAVFIDDEVVPSKRFSLESEEDTYKLFEENKPRKVKMRLIKISEAAFAKVGIKEIIVEGESSIRPTESKARRIEFIGDSITCGYGIEGVFEKDTFNTLQENPWEAYAAKSARYFDADFNCVSWSGIGIISSWTDKDIPNTEEWLMPELYKYTDGGLEKSLGKEQYEVWDNYKFQPHLVVINLGTNDMSYTKGIDDRIKQFEEGYYKLLNQVRQCNPNSQILCTLGVMGQDLCESIENSVERFKKLQGDTKVHICFFDVQLEKDGIGADWHPSLTTQDKMSKRLIKKIEEIMLWK